MPRSHGLRSRDRAESAAEFVRYRGLEVVQEGQNFRKRNRYGDQTSATTNRTLWLPITSWQLSGTGSQVKSVCICDTWPSRPIALRPNFELSAHRNNRSELSPDRKRTRLTYS